ncbi:tRNA1(Val) (adenine(37)-N6)-methyltransferase [Paenibacillus physcomitrellae]|uniref:Methyltransferase n=1 Tax=Paenibacillus physcomitrellae TaxID=1619311 RepID=A0ABQ1GWJ2_9BACL|nr:tRNA1(Val) (adenine(37)-N6)-methyltransferase [Paenibacillus physcomitrellae]GGA51215.1 methyltransferase [Paenibacillus physcomitrellae]
MSEQVEIYEQERIDDLMNEGLRLIQSDEVFSFSMDAVLLSRFASLPNKGRILDMCTGNGVIPILMSVRTNGQIEGIEIQDRLADMARRSVRLNGLEDRILIRTGDLRELVQEVGANVYDAITVNPPYMPLKTGDRKLNPHQAMARHELHGSLEEIIAAAMRLLRPGGKFYMVHKPQRLGEILSLLRQYKLEPKVIRFVHPKLTQEANMVLIEALRGGKPDIRLKPPLVVYEPDGRYTKELMEIYYGDSGGQA